MLAWETDDLNEDGWRTAAREAVEAGNAKGSGKVMPDPLFFGLIAASGINVSLAFFVGLIAMWRGYGERHAL